MRVRMQRDFFAVDARCDDWEEASDTFLSFRAEPPEGYRLVTAQVKPRTGDDGSFRSGRRCNLTMIFEHCDSRVKAFTESEAYSFFRTEGLEVPQP